MEIELKDLIPGEIYFQQSKTYPKNYYLSQYSPEGNEFFITISTGRLNKSGQTDPRYIETVRIASFSEKRWLMDCIKANRTVSKKHIFNLWGLIQKDL